MFTKSLTYVIMYTIDDILNIVDSVGYSRLAYIYNVAKEEGLFDAIKYLEAVLDGVCLY